MDTLMDTKRWYDKQDSKLQFALMLAFGREYPLCKGPSRIFFDWLRRENDGKDMPLSGKELVRMSQQSKTKGYRSQSLSSGRHSIKSAVR